MARYRDFGLVPRRVHPELVSPDPYGGVRLLDPNDLARPKKLQMRGSIVEHRPGDPNFHAQPRFQMDIGAK